MKKVQKVALMTFITLSVCTVLAAIAVSTLYYMGSEHPWGGCGVFGLVGILGFSWFIFKKDDEPYDELDKEIYRRSSKIGYVAAFLTCCIACMLPFRILGSEATISIRWLPHIFGIMGYAYAMTYSISLLVLYRRCGSEEVYE